MNRLSALVLSLTLVFGMSACSSEAVEQTSELKAVAETASAELNAAEVIELKKKAGLCKHYTIKADGEEFGELKGLVLRVPGDVFAITTTEGAYIGGQEQGIFKRLTPATVYDREGEDVGSFKRSLNSVKATYLLRDKEKGTRAELKTKFSFYLKGDLKDSSGKVIYKVTTGALDINRSITLTKVDETDDFTATEAVLMATLASVIHDSK